MSLEDIGNRKCKNPKGCNFFFTVMGKKNEWPWEIDQVDPDDILILCPKCKYWNKGIKIGDTGIYPIP